MSMLILPEHAHRIDQSIKDLLARTPTHQLRAWASSLLTDPRVKDADKRARWDLFRAAVPSLWVCDVIYPYAADPHIDTVLRRVAPTIEDILGASNPPTEGAPL